MIFQSTQESSQVHSQSLSNLLGRGHRGFPFTGKYAGQMGYTQSSCERYSCQADKLPVKEYTLASWLVLQALISHLQPFMIYVELMFHRKEYNRRICWVSIGRIEGAWAEDWPDPHTLDALGG